MFAKFDSVKTLITLIKLAAVAITSPATISVASGLYATDSILRVPGLKRCYRQRSPAMAAGLTNHLWRVGNLLSLPLLLEAGAS
jgi:hypothetical protein